MKINLFNHLLSSSLLCTVSVNQISEEEEERNVRFCSIFMTNLAASKVRLLEALAYFLSFQPIEDIKVSELIKRAQVSHSTFYRAFETKEDFFQWVLDYHMEGLSKSAKETSQTPQAFYRHYFQFIYDHAIYFKVFNNSSMWPQFNSELYQIGIASYRKFIYQQTGDAKRSQLISNYIIHAHIGVVVSWLKETTLSSPEEVATLVITLSKAALSSQKIDLADAFPMFGTL